MKSYQIELDDGRKFRVDVDEGSGSQSPSSGYWSDVKQNAIAGLNEWPGAIQNMASLGAKVIPGVTLPGISKSIAESVTGTPFHQTPTGQSLEGIGNVVKSVPSMVTGLASDIADTVRHPIDTFRNKPLSTTANVISVGLPVAKGIRALFAPTVLATEAGTQVGPSLAKRLFAKGMRGAFGVPEEATLARMENPAAVKTAFTPAEIANQMPESMVNLQTKIGQLDDAAKGTLSTSKYINEGAIPKTQIEDAVRLSRQNLGGIFSEESKAAAGALNRVKTYYKKLTNTVSQQQVKDLIGQIDDDINWANPQASRTNEALIGVRTRLDGLLKTKNMAYRDAMAPVEEAINTRNEMQKAFSITKPPKQGFQATDMTAGKIQSSLKENKVGTQRILNKFQNVTGEDYSTKIKNATNRALFEGSNTNGSRRAVVGTAIGAGAGYSLGLPPAITGALGAIGGAFTDIYGKQMAAGIIDTLANPVAKKFIPILERAAKGGTANLLKVHTAMIGNDPEYAALMQDSTAAGNTAGKILTETKAREYLKKAGGDRNAARAMATADGWTY